MKKKLFTLFILLYMFTFHISTAFCVTSSENSTISTPPEIEADAGILMDASTGEILFEKNMNKEEYPASITKLMTVLLAFEYGNLDDTITFSKEAVFGIERNSSHIAIDVGEQITMEQALYAILLQSANEVSLGVAEHISGSKEEFSKLMNKRAKELGCTSTNFLNPNGLHDENHYTTAHDMALIAKEVLKYDKFREIISTIHYKIPPTNKQKETRNLYVQHQMIKPPSIYVYEGCEGGKTGFTNEAQNTLVTYAKKGDMELIAVVFKCHGAGHYVDTAKLFDYGFENFKTVKAFSKSNFSQSVPVTQQYNDRTIEEGTVTITAKEDIYLTLPINESENNLKQNIVCPDKLTAPITQNTPVGKLELISNNKILASTELISNNTVKATPIETLKEEDKAAFIKKLKGYVATGGIIVLGIVTIVTVFIIKRRNAIRRRKRRRYRQRYKTDYSK